ncbi:MULTISPECIES: DUF6809 family protein [Paenibacillus]|uniref:DUF6809 family protein n=1 Tax=Paenibacillus TaxID=44249 RepID=UPI00073EF877|nr:MULTISPECIES: DUF6809 family protein [Paenibacillus]MDU4695902.1 hypothetical protein [Paenibacillus sp.]
MKRIIEEFYYGNLKPEERMIPATPAYRPLNRHISDLMEEAKKKFSERDFELLEQILDLNGESSSMVTSEAFVQGFRMGALMMVEVFDGDGGIEISK